jgi:cytochrome c-type biogenesis protein CcmH/NrfG
MAALERNPGDVRLWNLQGDLLTSRQNRKGAEDAYRRSLGINSMQPDISAKLRDLGGKDSR